MNNQEKRSHEALKALVEELRTKKLYHAIDTHVMAEAFSAAQGIDNIIKVEAAA